MTSVAFFRNLNLGHPGSPTGTELIDAFGGPSAASTFQTNGTVVIRAADPASVTRRALARLSNAGYLQPCVVRTLDEVTRIVKATEPLPHGSDIYRLMVSFFDIDEARALPGTPLRAPDGLVEVREIGPLHAVSACWKPGNSAGDVTGFLEQLLGVQVTTRSLATLTRLVARGSSR